MNVLYLTHDGLGEPLGESQVLSYVNGLADKGVEIGIVSFEKSADIIYIENIQKKISKKVFFWKYFNYTNKPPIISTLISLVGLLIFVLKQNQRKKISIIHSRSYLMTLIAFIINKLLGIPYIFDMRGWWIDERIESNLWSNKFYLLIIYFFRKIERRLFKNAAHVICLTKCASFLVRDKFSIPLSRISIIPTCVNFGIFKPIQNDFFLEKKREELGLLSGDFVMVYSGSIGGIYDAKEILLMYRALKEIKEGAFFLILSKVPSIEVYKEAERNNIDSSKILILNVPHDEVNGYLNICNLGLVSYSSDFSSTSRSPTKMAEYWAAGIHVIAPMDLGDIDEVFSYIINPGCQYKMNDYNSYINCINLYFKTMMDRKVSVTSDFFEFYSLDSGIDKYFNVYNLINSKQIL